MKSKAQVSIFVIMGVLVVIAAGLAISLLGKGGKFELGKGSITGSAVSLDFYRDSCVEDAVAKAMIYRSFGPNEMNKGALEEYIKWRTYRCLEAISFPDQTYDVKIDQPSSERVKVQVSINEESITVEGTYPVEATREGKKESVSGFRYTYPKSSHLNIKTGTVATDTNLVSPDGETFAIQIPRTTSFLSYDGLALEKMSLKIADKTEVSDNPYLIGNQVYRVTDSVPSNPVRACMGFDLTPYDLVNKEDLSLAWYDNERDIWIIHPSEVDVSLGRVCAEISHFTDQGLVNNVYSYVGGWTFFKEHIHRPCSPDPGFEGYSGQAEISREKDYRYVGLYNRLPQEKKWDDEGVTRWKFNDFTENSQDTPHRYSVYATPQMYKSLLIRGHDEKDSEFRFKDTDIIVQKRDIYDEAGKWKLGEFNTNTYTFNTVVVRQTLNDRLSDKNIGLTNAEHGKKEDWVLVPSYEPNEHAEMKLSIQDWDDDDLKSIKEEYCFDTPFSQSGECMTCNGLSCKSFGPRSQDLTGECYNACVAEAKNLYKPFEDMGWAPWNEDTVSTDGLLDYKWVGTEQKPNKVNCIVSVGEYASVSKCDIKDTDLATPMFYGYGDEKTGLRAGQGKYRDEPEYGYEGVGNNDNPPDPYTFKIVSPLCPDPAAKLTVGCTEKDKCVVVLNGKQFECESKTCTFDILPEELIGSNKGDNTITGWVTNTLESQDVCASVNATLVTIECPSTKKEPDCGNNIREGSEICDGTDDAACPGKCVAAGLPNECTCPLIGNYCGDGIVQNPNSNGGFEICDINQITGTGDDTACPGLCLPDCTCPELKPFCGNNIREGSEICDGTDDAACPGKCVAAGLPNECTCPTPTTLTCNSLCDNSENKCSSPYVCDGASGRCRNPQCPTEQDCSCPPQTQGPCIVCHWDQGVPGCFREDTSNCPNSWRGHDDHEFDKLICDPSNPPYYSNGERVTDCTAGSSCPFIATCLGEVPGNSCGNGECQPNKGENVDTCPEDCKAPSEPVCGDGTCQGPKENSNTCCRDCGCTGNKVCNTATDVCEVKPEEPVNPVCGQNGCEAGENSNSCCIDCGCTGNRVCVNNECTTNNEPEPPEPPTEPPVCTPSCDGKGCGDDDGCGGMCEGCPEDRPVCDTKTGTCKKKS